MKLRAWSQHFIVTIRLSILEGALQYQIQELLEARYFSKACYFLVLTTLRGNLRRWSWSFTADAVFQEVSQTPLQLMIINSIAHLDISPNPLKRSNCQEHKNRPRSNGKWLEGNLAKSRLGQYFDLLPEKR